MPHFTHHQPHPPKVLTLLESLDSRMTLPETANQHFQNLSKGYIGELNFYKLLNEEQTSQCLRLFDLSLRRNNTEFQIDSLLIFPNKIYLCDVKYFSGNFYMQGHDWFVKSTRKEISNPINQLKRCQRLLQELLQELGYSFQIEAYVIFNHPQFTLYQASMDHPMIFPTQLKQFMRKLNQETGLLSRRHSKLAHQLIELHHPNPAYQRTPSYNYQHLKKGIPCVQCGVFLTSTTARSFQCHSCHHVESVESAIMRNIREFHLLFPNTRVTTSIIYEWCDAIVSQKRIRRVLSKNLKQINRARYSYFTF